MPEGDMKKHVQEEIRRIEEHQRSEDHIERYNDAVAKASRGEYRAAHDLLQQLLAENPEESLATSARRVLEKLKPLVAKKK